MESYHAHQLILPTDKRNPCFTLYATEDQQSIRVFYGLELMEVVPDDPDQMASGNPPHLTALPPWCPSEEITCSQNPITTTDDLAVIIPESSPQADCSALSPIEGEPTPSKCSPLNSDLTKRPR